MTPTRYRCTIDIVADELRDREAIVWEGGVTVDELREWGAPVVVRPNGEVRVHVFHERTQAAYWSPVPYGWYLVRRLNGNVFFPAERDWFDRTHEVVL